MKTCKFLFFVLLFAVLNVCGIAQDGGLLFLKGSLPSTYINPSIPLEKKIQISLAGINTFAGTDGPTIEDITSKNASGKRFIDVINLSQKLNSENSIFGGVDVHTFDVGVRIGATSLIAGHAFKSFGNITYPGKLVELIARGNAPFIGQTLDIGTSVDYFGYNELYLGGQYEAGNFSIGVKGKVLFGTNNLSTERHFTTFTTKPEIYQWELEIDYIVRNTGILNYQALDSVSLDLKSFSFDNLFVRNRGLGLDLGISWKMSDKLLLMAGASDIGSIIWNNAPKKYSSRGNFTFEGLDLINLLGEKENISISDTLLDIIEVKSETETYTTKLNSRFHVGGSYDLNDLLSFNALYSFQERFGAFSHQLSLSALLRFSVLQTGLTYSLSKNNFTSVGIFGRITAGPFSLYIQGDNIPGLLNPLKNKNAGLRFGTTFEF